MGDKKNKATVTNIIRRLVLILMGVIIGLNFYLMSAGKLSGNQLPMPFGTGCAVVLSGSMEPSYKVNDLIIVREADTYDVNDVVVYQSGFELIVHRIVDVDGDIVTTKGDANITADAPIDIGSIKGRVVLAIPGIGLIAKILKTPAAVIILGFAAFALVELSFKKETKADNKDIEAIREEIRSLKAKMEEKTNEEEN